MTDGPSAINMIERWPGLLDKVPVAPGSHPTGRAGELSEALTCLARQRQSQRAGDLGIMLILRCHKGVKIGRHGGQRSCGGRLSARTLPCIGSSELVGLGLYPEPTE